MEPLPRAPVRHSLLRRIPWLGGDRRIVGMSGLLAATLGWTIFAGFGFLYGLSVIVPALLFFGGLWVAKRMYNADPWMLDLVIRHFKYAKYYAPKTHVGKALPSIRDFKK